MVQSTSPATSSRQAWISYTSLAKKLEDFSGLCPHAFVEFGGGGVSRPDVALNVLDSWEKRMPEFQAKGVRWWNVRARAYLDRGVKQYVELLNRYGG